MRCEKCGKEGYLYKSLNTDGTLIFLCNDCERDKLLKPIQFEKEIKANRFNNYCAICKEKPPLYNYDFKDGSFAYICKDCGKMVFEKNKFKNKEEMYSYINPHKKEVTVVVKRLVKVR